jgi:hypothetical protein
MADLVRTLPESSRAELRAAFDALEYPSFAARLSSVLGTPLEAGLRLLHPAWERAIRRAAEVAVNRALQAMVGTFPANAAATSSNGRHARACIGAGAIGGFFGLPGLLLEAPFTTAIILRSIADIARAQGESLTDTQTQLACIEVFALGGPSTEDDAAETGYYGVRLAMAAHFSAFRLLLGRPASEVTLPSTVVAVRAVASRFGFAISEKAAAQMVPILGAAAGAVVNGLFIRHFQSIATGHFTVRRLERQYGSDVVHTEYENIRQSKVEAARQKSSAGKPARQERTSPAPITN